jgi:ribonuclease-3
MQKNIIKLEDVLSYQFTNKTLLKIALTHKTYAFEAEIPLEYNERLEFLGDSILSFVIAEHLYQTNSFFTEGELTRRRSVIVNNRLLAKKAKELQIGKYLLLGKGEQKQQGQNTPSTLANALEAIIGAIYLDSDFSTVQSFILSTLFNDIL